MAKDQLRRIHKTIALVVTLALLCLSGYGYLEASHYARAARDDVLGYVETRGYSKADFYEMLDEKDVEYFKTSGCTYAVSTDGDELTVTAYRSLPFPAFSSSSFSYAKAINHEYSGIPANVKETQTIGSSMNDLAFIAPTLKAFEDRVRSIHQSTSKWPANNAEFFKSGMLSIRYKAAGRFVTRDWDSATFSVTLAKLEGESPTYDLKFGGQERSIYIPKD